MNELTSRLILLFSLTTFFSLPISANIDVYQFSDEERRMNYLELTKELRCPKCQNQDIADSNAPIAADMRKEVHRLLEEGSSPEEVVQFMIDRFGDFVTYKPKVSSETLMLWYGPWIFIIFGMGVIAYAVRNKRNTKQDKPGTSTSNDSVSDSRADSTNNKVQALLREFDADNDQDKS